MPARSKPIFSTQIALPSNRDAWEASNTESWANCYKPQQIDLPTALRKILFEGDTALLRRFGVSALHALLSGMMSIHWDVTSRGSCKYFQSRMISVLIVRSPFCATRSLAQTARTKLPSHTGLVRGVDRHRSKIHD